MMLRDIFRSVGIGCLLAGGILYFAGSAGEGTPKPADDSQVKKLEEELEAVKKELAIAQRTSSADHNQTETPKKENASSSQGQIIKTILTIETGAVSTKISSRLERAGIIDSAKDFDQYLQNNGLSGRIQVGDYEVDSSMDLKTIAAIITKTK